VRSSADPVRAPLFSAASVSAPLLIRLRDYHLLFPNLMVRMANTMSASALPLLLVTLGFPLGQVGWMVSLGALTSMLMNLVGGFISDCWPRKRLMMAGIAGVALSTGLLAVARSGVAFIVVRLVQGLATGVFRPASQALAYDLNPRRRAQVIGLLGSSYVLGNALGPAFGGHVGDSHGLRTCMLVAALLAVCGGAYLGLVCHALPACGAVRQPFGGQVRRVLRGRSGQAAAPLTVAMMDAWILGCTHVYLPIYLKQTLGLGYTEIGLLLGFESAVYVVCQPVAACLIARVGPRLPVALSVLGHGLFVAAIPLVDRTWWIAACLAAAGMTNSAAHPGSVLLAARLAADTDRGASLGVLSSASNLGQFLGPIVGGALIAGAGQQKYVLFAALVPALVGALAPLCLLPRRRPGPAAAQGE
jgi:MFS family permease